MMFRSLVTLFVLGIFVVSAAGCRKTTGQATYRAAGQAQAMQIDVIYYHARREIEIDIDGQKVIKTDAERRSTVADNAEYKGHKIGTTITRTGRKVHCTVTVDNEVAGNWDF